MGLDEQKRTAAMTNSGKKIKKLRKKLSTLLAKYKKPCKPQSGNKSCLWSATNDGKLKLEHMYELEVVFRPPNRSTIKIAKPKLPVDRYVGEKCSEQHCKQHRIKSGPLAGGVVTPWIKPGADQPFHVTIDFR